MLLMFFVEWQGVSFAQNKADPKKQEEAKKTEPTPPKFNVGDFTYTSANRRDPFEAVSLGDSKKLGKTTSLKRGYELEELRLVGIINAGNNNIVMMEDMQGKGILFKKNDYLNKNLWIVNILVDILFKKNDYLNKNLWIVNILVDKVEFGYKIKGEIKTFILDIPRKKEGT